MHVPCWIEKSCKYYLILAQHHLMASWMYLIKLRSFATWYQLPATLSPPSLKKEINAIRGGWDATPPKKNRGEKVLKDEFTWPAMGNLSENISSALSEGCGSGRRALRETWLKSVLVKGGVKMWIYHHHSFFPQTLTHSTCHMCMASFSFMLPWGCCGRGRETER